MEEKNLAICRTKSFLFQDFSLRRERGGKYKSRGKSIKNNVRVLQMLFPTLFSIEP
jgi:hypothetical protein